MASDQSFVDFVLDELDGVGSVSAKKMFGEYALYCGTKIFALICGNQLFIKPTDAGRAFIGEPLEAPPYPGAKNSFLIEENLEDPAWLSELVRISVRDLPEPKPKKKKTTKI
jgi:TfoX/Sxy family transcriptional regulator of competence genes